MERFFNLLASLSHICPLSFVVDDGKSFAFSSESNGNDPRLTRFLRRFSARVAAENAFVHESNESPFLFYGIPVESADGPTAVIMSYKEKGSSPGDDGDCEKMENLLLSLSALMGEGSSAQKELDSMAEQLSQSFEAISLYSRITPHLTSLGFSEKTLHGLMTDLRETVGADLIFADLPGKPGYSLYVPREGETRVSHPCDLAQALVKAIPPDAPTLGDGYYIAVDSKALPQLEGLHPEPFRFLTAEVRHMEDHYGWLGLVSFNMNQIFRYSDLRMIVSAANQIAVALTNINLYAELERFLVNVVRSLVYAIEAKDTYTRGHSERVSQYCMQIADRLLMGEGEKRDILWASTLHDVGKIGISEKVLNKPGKLTEEEYEQIKTHPQKGYNILKPLTPLASCLDAVRHHHERYDGKGYPQGLGGESIPLQARIIAVADTYDAITSDRSYRSRKTRSEAVAIMREIAGTQLDAEIVRTFIGILDESPGAGDSRRASGDGPDEVE